MILTLLQSIVPVTIILIDICLVLLNLKMKVWNQNYTNLNLEEILFKINSCCFIDTLMVAIFITSNFIFLFCYIHILLEFCYFCYIIEQRKFRCYNKTLVY